MEYSIAFEKKFDVAAWMMTQPARVLFGEHIDQLADCEDDMTRAQWMGLLMGSIVHACVYGDVFYCSREITRTLHEVSSTMPDWTLLDELIPAPAGFVWLQEPIEMPMVDESDPEHYAMHGFSWFTLYNADPEPDAGERLRQQWWGPRKEDLPEVAVGGLSRWQFFYALLTIPGNNTVVPGHQFKWPVGHSFMEYANSFGGAWSAADDLMGRFIGSFFQFMKQEIFIAPTERATRPARRRVEQVVSKLPLVLTSDGVRVVQLRKRHYNLTSSAEHEADREYTCQWVVRGHWRQQWYPSLQRNQPKWIAPYVKGPEDKPLKPPRATVFAVVR